MANTLGHWATMSSICIWKISWDIFSPKGTRKNLYLPRWVLNVVRSDASSVRCIPKKALLPLTFENLVAPWEHGLSPRGLGPCGSHEWWPCLGPWGQGKSSACHLPSLDTSDCWPTVWALSVWWWFSDGPSLLTPSWSPPCTRWAPSVCRAGLVGL